MPYDEALILKYDWKEIGSKHSKQETKTAYGDGSYKDGGCPTCKIATRILVAISG